MTESINWMTTGVLSALLSCGRGPPPGRSRGAPPPREERASGPPLLNSNRMVSNKTISGEPVLLSSYRPEAGRASASSAWGWGPKRNLEC